MNDQLTISTYRVLASHPDTDVTLDVDLIATSGRAAVSRARGSLVHLYRDVRWLDGDYDVWALHAGTCAQNGHGRDFHA